MNKIYYGFLPVLLLALALGVSAQDTQLVTQESISRLGYIKPGGAGFGTFSNVDRVEGNPFFMEDWQEGRIRFEGQVNYSEDLELLLDMDDNHCYIRLSTGFEGEFPMGRLDVVEVFTPADTLVFDVLNLKELFGEGEPGRKFYRILHREEYMVIHQPIKYLQREKYIENLGMVRRPDKYEETNRYFVFDGSSLFQVKRNVRSLTKTFPRKSSQIKRLIRTHNLDLKVDADLAQLFALLEE